MTVAASNAVRVAHRDGIAVVTVDNPPVNALSQAVRTGLIDAFTALARDPAVTAIVLIGAGRDFIAGADIREMENPLEPQLPEVLQAIDRTPQPIVAAIAGSALGGGYEIAMACDLRLAGPKALVGMPETRLGIIPGSTGTQRLPRLVGIAKAIELVSQAKLVRAAEAQALGLIDRIVDEVLLDAAIDAARTAKKDRIADRPVPAEDEAVIEAAAKTALQRARGVPAVAAAVDLIRAAATTPYTEGLVRERETFLRLRASPEAKALRHLFFAEREAAKIPGFADPATRPIATAAVIGGGTMGSGIAVALADSGIDVHLLERDAAAAAAGADRVAAIYDRQVASRRLTPEVAAERRARVRASDDWSAVAGVDLVIEAVFEDMAVKTDVFRRLDGLAKPGAILATNTSYLDIDAIAAATGRPQDVVGLHFFSPANVMRLLEVVRAAKTAPDVLATALALGKRIGKLPIVAGVCDGFIGNRIFSVYRRQMEYFLEDGAYPHEIDAALEAYGFAMGPFKVSDLAGLDIAWATRKRRAATRDPGERYVDIPDRICEQGHFGRKTGRGWYRYADAAAKPQVDPDVIALIDAERARKGITPQPIAPDRIVASTLAIMANEGAKILAGGIALRASDIDLVLVNGYGFPAVKGGPMFAADQAGLADTLARVEELHARNGVGSEPAPLLRELAASGGSFTARG